MSSLHEVVLKKLEHIWKEHVRTDYFNGDMTYGEQVVHACIAHHLRNHLTELSNFRVWHEVSISSIHPKLRTNPRKDKRTLDLVLAFAETKDLTEEIDNEIVPRDLSDVRNVELFVAIEVKYAPYPFRTKEFRLDEDIDKLVEIRNEYLPDIHPIFVYIPGTDQTKEIGSWKNMLTRKAKECSVSFLFGDPVDANPEKWTVDFNQK